MITSIWRKRRKVEEVRALEKLKSLRSFMREEKDQRFTKKNMRSSSLAIFKRNREKSPSLLKKSRLSTPRLLKKKRKNPKKKRRLKKPSLNRKWLRKQ